MTNTGCKQILIPTDFSTSSDSALRCAMYWNETVPVSVHIFHRVAGMPADWDRLDEMGRQKHTNILEAVDKAKNQLKFWEDALVNAGIEYTVVFSGGAVGDFLAEYEANNEIDLIIMGAYGRGMKDRVKMGSNTIDTLRKVISPVLVTRHSADRFDFSEVVFASTFDVKAKKAYSAVLNLIRPFSPQLFLLHVEVPSVFRATRFITMEAMKDFKDAAGDFVVESHMHKHSDVGRGIVEFCDKVGADLIALSESGVSIFGAERIAKPVKHLVLNASHPVLFAQGGYDTSDNKG